MTAPTLARKTFWLSLKYWFGWLIPESQETPCVASKVNVQASCIFHYADKLVSSGIAYCSVKLMAMKYIQHLVMPVLHFIHYLFQCMPTDAHFVECGPQIFITANTIKQRQIHGGKHQVQSRAASWLSCNVTNWHGNWQVNFTTECYFVLTIIKEETISWTNMNKETRQHHISNNYKSISHCSA